MRRTRLKSLTLPLLALIGFNLLPQLYLRPFQYSALALGFLGYRVMMEVGGWPSPKRWMLWLVQIASAAIIWNEFRTLFGDQASGALLTLLTCLKSFELKEKRDYFVNVCLCLMVLMSYLLLDQSLLLTGFLLVDVVLILSLLYALETETWNRANLKAYARPTYMMMLKALPLMVICFLLFPRFTTGFGTGTPEAKTGMTDQLRPGSIAKLANSEQLVFRVSYAAGEIPVKTNRYWRGAVLDVSRGLDWDRSKSLRGDLQTRIPLGNETVEVHLEPGFERYLFLPENSLSLAFASGKRLLHREDGTYELLEPLKTRERYMVSVSETPNREDLVEIEPWLHTSWIPSRRLRDTIAELRAPTPTETVSRILKHFREGGFTYSLEPPEVADVEEFLFNTRTGFCEHYAATTATLLRLMRIPARVVTGFQGGIESYLESYVTVRALDAHAWVEYYDSNSRRWRRVDPTAEVAPMRLALGAGVLTESRGWFTRWAGLTAYYRVRAMIDEVDAAWVSFLLRFDLARQRELLAKVGMEAAIFRALPVFLILTIVLFLAVLYFVEAQRREPLTREERLYRHLLRQLKRLKAEKGEVEGPLDLMSRLRRERPELAPQVEPILEPLILARYGGQPLEDVTANAVARRLKSLR